MIEILIRPKAGGKTFAVPFSQAAYYSLTPQTGWRIGGRFVVQTHLPEPGGWCVTTFGEVIGTPPPQEVVCPTRWERDYPSFMEAGRAIAETVHQVACGCKGDD